MIVDVFHSEQNSKLMMSLDKVVTLLLTIIILLFLEFLDR